jgi:cysteate synthase
MFRYADWLPVKRIHAHAGRTVTFQNEALAERLGLDNLFIAFNGYWPEKDAAFETGSFKELEALTVTARIPEGENRCLVMASAGNSGMAFLQICSEYAVPVVVVVPAKSLKSMWITRAKHPDAILVALNGKVDYFDAIELANAIAEQDGFYNEGGALNVARRDGMGSVLLSAAETMGRIPDHYVQAIGSGTGGIAAWEMSQRLLEDGSYGNAQMRLHLVQNSPFAIMTDAWEQSAKELPLVPPDVARRRISHVYAKVLSNRRPPYSITGGVYDVLKDSQGFTYKVTNPAARKAGRLFEAAVGCDLHPAAAVALAGLQQAVAAGRIPRDETVLLNVTGGGIKRLEAEGKKVSLKADITLTPGGISPDKLAARILEIRKANGTLK